MKIQSLKCVRCGVVVESTVFDFFEELPSVAWYATE